MGKKRRMIARPQKFGKKYVNYAHMQVLGPAAPPKAADAIEEKPAKPTTTKKATTKKTTTKKGAPKKKSTWFAKKKDD